MPQKVVAQFDWAAVKERPHPTYGATYDIWSWNVYKLKWTRMNNHGCGFGTLENASVGAKQTSDEIAAMLAANQTKPKPL